MHYSFCQLALHPRGVAALMMLPLSLGCGPSSDLEKVIVSGKVTLNGKPIENGEVLFYPTGRTQGSVSGGPIKGGRYVAKGRGGVPLGTHRVQIRAFRPQGGRLPSEAAREGGPAEQYLPPKYNTNSQLTAEVDSSTSQLDFELSSQ